MSFLQRHEDVAAYALGVLEPGDAFGFEEHLGECVLCTVQLSELGGAVSALSALTGPSVPGGPPAAAGPSPRLETGLLEAVRLARRSGRLRRLRLVAAAAVLIMAIPAVAHALRAAPDGPVTEARKDPVRVTATNAATGVTASAEVEEYDWGTAVAVRLSGLRGPATCRLVAIGTDGIEHPVLSWKVPASGYGVPRTLGGTGPAGGAEALEIAGGTAVPSARIGRWEVRAYDGTTLVTLGSGGP
jgi:anti-sigma factor RsiW